MSKKTKKVKIKPRATIVIDLRLNCKPQAFVDLKKEQSKNRCREAINVGSIE